MNNFKIETKTFLDELKKEGDKSFYLLSEIKRAMTRARIKFLKQKELNKEYGIQP